MSAKYQRVKQADLALPAPLRWLTRTFSSITMAVTLLSLVVLYGLVASVPVAFLARGGLYALAVLTGVGGGILAARSVSGLEAGNNRPAKTAQREAQPRSDGTKFRLFHFLIPVTLGVAFAACACIAITYWAAQSPWIYQNRAEVIYRLPYFEMTELEFYGWWPLKLILALFVLNLIWATVRRIEFKFANLGVLTVHTGIITVALGSIFYSRAKIEGDAILFRHDLGGQPAHEFYDATTAAVYFTTGEHNLMIPLPHLPRYNDYKDDLPRPLDIDLDSVPQFSQVLGPRLHASIRQFISYGELAPTWVDASTTDEPPLFDRPNPAIRIEAGDKSRPDGSFSKLLVSGVPVERVIDAPAWAIEYLDSPEPQRLSDLTAQFDGEQGLVVEVPGAGFHGVYAIHPGQTITVGDTGYTLKIEAIGPYGMSFATRGYEGAQDTRAMVQITKVGPDARQFRRIVMHRYPERSQDFVPAPGDPNVGPMGKRTAPDPTIRLAYLDASKLQFWIISDIAEQVMGGSSSPTETMRLLVRIPGHKPFLGIFPQGAFPIGTADGQDRWMHVTQRITNAVQVMEPTITPRNQRQPKDEGTFLHALLPIDLTLDPPTPGTSDSPAKPWHKRVWLAHMRYPNVPDDQNHPVEVQIPGIGAVMLAFSRRKMELPFSIALDDFEMQPYPGTEIPRDFIARLSIVNPGEGNEPPSLFNGEAHLNNPLLYEGIKISQTGWDPGEPTDPARNARDDHNRFTHQQRFTILGIGNNRGIHVIFVGACLIILGIPWAFYVKPWLAQRQKRKIQASYALAGASGFPAGPGASGASGKSTNATDPARPARPYV